MQAPSQLPNTTIAPTLQACKKALVKHYGHRLQGLILFGSAARQEMTSTSDIDLLILLPQPLDYFQELRDIVDLLYPIQLEASHWISARPAAQADFSAGITQLYRNIQKEGVAV